MPQARRIKQTKKSGRRWTIFFAVVMMVLIGIACVSGYMIIRYYMDAAKTKVGFHDLARQIVSPTGEEDIDSASQTSVWTVDTQYGKLFAQNADMVGWLSIPDTTIDFPVMHTPEDEEYYLRKNFSKEYSEDGTPFVAANCAVDPASDNIIIYGHNMYSGNMFAPLASYKEKSFYDSHKKIYFDTTVGFGTYEIVGMFKVDINEFEYYRFINAADQTAFDEFMNKVKALSYYETGVSASYGDKLITLSTCDNAEDTGRYVVVAKKVSDKHESQLT